jgi:hypothetical protein
MPRRKVVLSGLLAFGAGVAVGANWPRAGNIVGYILQRLGFELTDLTLWMWDPEKLSDKAELAAPVGRPKAKKRRRTPSGQSVGLGATGSRAKKISVSPGSPSGARNGGTRKIAAHTSEAWILNSRLSASGTSGSDAPERSSRTGKAALTKLDNSAVQAVRRKAKNAAITNKRKSPVSGSNRKISAFSKSPLPANSALN